MAGPSSGLPARQAVDRAEQRNGSAAGIAAWAKGDHLGAVRSCKDAPGAAEKA